MKVKKAHYAGFLYAQGKTYRVLHYKPVEGDSWQRDGERRFVVVPDVYVSKKVFGEQEYVFPPARHIIVSGDYLLEITNPSRPIYIEVRDSVEEESPETVTPVLAFDDLDEAPTIVGFEN